MTIYQQQKDQWNITGTLTATSHGKRAENHERKKLFSSSEKMYKYILDSVLLVEEDDPFRALMWIYVDFNNNK